MRILITGGAGFLGRKLAAALLARGTLTDAAGATRRIDEIVLLDVGTASTGGDARLVAVAGDLGDRSCVEPLFAKRFDSVFHLAAVVSGEAEQNFDLGWRVNVDATRGLLELCRRQASPAKFVFTSSAAVFGGNLPPVLADTQELVPQSSYGAQKAVGEFYVHDYTRKGMIVGRSLRLPTVSVRPGKPNKAASSFASGIIREPLAGVEAICPVAPETVMWLASPRATVANLIAGHEAPASAFATTHSINVPGISISVGAMVDALRRVAGEDVAARVRWQRDPVIERIVETWPRAFEPKFGQSLGMRGDADFESIIRQHIDDEVSPPQR